ncbi:uncharacterized protein LOC116441709 [Corvus moneduloides]|uniref:uncharacterized protein LOC116441709 n=1 Tax=Corvus moneduloides TaxID=1196302 RepID=UPI001363CCEE|nr:uncharacterized protein LOC116441709 [Corvus moneduloides]
MSSDHGWNEPSFLFRSGRSHPLRTGAALSCTIAFLEGGGRAGGVAVAAVSAGFAAPWVDPPPPACQVGPAPTAALSAAPAGAASLPAALQLPVPLLQGLPRSVLGAARPPRSPAVPYPVSFSPAQDSVVLGPDDRDSPAQTQWRHEPSSPNCLYGGTNLGSAAGYRIGAHSAAGDYSRAGYCCAGAGDGAVSPGAGTGRGARHSEHTAGAGRVCVRAGHRGTYAHRRSSPCCGHHRSSRRGSRLRRCLSPGPRAGAGGSGATCLSRGAGRGVGPCAPGARITGGGGGADHVGGAGCCNPDSSAKAAANSSRRVPGAARIPASAVSLPAAPPAKAPSSGAAPPASPAQARPKAAVAAPAVWRGTATPSGPTCQSPRGSSGTLLAGGVSSVATPTLASWQDCVTEPRRKNLQETHLP